MRTPAWSLSHKIRFIAAYAWSKLMIAAHVHSPRFVFCVFEWKYSLVNLVNTIFGPTLPPVMYRGPSRIETDCGVFEIRSGSQDAAVVSPAFEAGDQKFLSGLLKSELADGEFDFLDVGANIGTFSVRVGMQAPRARGWAFEPIADNLKVLRANLALNGLHGFQVMPFALGESRKNAKMEFRESQPGDARIVAGEGTQLIEVRRADDELKTLGSKLLIKIDVEGHEPEVLNGMAGIFSLPSRDIWLCIEDIFEREKLYSQLQGLGFDFVNKCTPYNSWWRRPVSK